MNFQQIILSRTRTQHSTNLQERTNRQWASHDIQLLRYNIAFAGIAFSQAGQA